MKLHTQDNEGAPKLIIYGRPRKSCYHYSGNRIAFL